VLDDDGEPGDPFDSHPRSFVLSPRYSVSLMARRTRHLLCAPRTVSRMILGNISAASASCSAALQKREASQVASSQRQPQPPIEHEPATGDDASAPGIRVGGIDQEIGALWHDQRGNLQHGTALLP
jgi:hypothetical protein